jgi:hypothetical protein
MLITQRGVTPAEYAINGLRSLLRQTSRDQGPEDPAVRYLCALFAEVAYYYIPEWEMQDARHRAKVIPCEAYQTLRERGTPTSILDFLAQLEFSDSDRLVVEDRGVMFISGHSYRAQHTTDLGWQGVHPRCTEIRRSHRSCRLATGSRAS